MFSLSAIEEEFVNRPGGQDAGRGLWFLLLIILCVFGGFVGWAAYFEIEEVTRAAGRVVPSSQVQSVQSVEGGVVAALAVQEGDTVTQGQVLFQIDDTSVQSRLGELEQRFQALSGELLRLRAEAAGAETLSFANTTGINDRVIGAETAIFETRKQQLSLELDVLQTRMAQKSAELSELLARRDRLRSVAKPLQREVEISTELFSQGALSEIEMLRLQSKLAETEGDLLVLAASQKRVEAGLEEIQTQINSARSAYGLVAKERISVVVGDMAIVEESLRDARARVSRTALRSPVHGVVNRINVTNVGGVVQPGKVLAEIVPLEDSLLIEAEVKPRDIAFVRVNAPASVKITAYDYLRYGDLPATVERIGADALQSNDGIPFFRVMLRTEKTSLEGDQGVLEISPGMVASIDIQSGKKTVLEYLLQPVLRVQHEALRER